MIILLVSTLLAGCHPQPRARVSNDLTGKINVSLQPEAGATITVNGISHGETTAFFELPQSRIRVHVSTSGSNPGDVFFTTHMYDTYRIRVTGDSLPVTQVTLE